MSTTSRKSLAETLLEGGFLTPEQLATARKVSQETGKKLGRVLVEQGVISPETLATVCSFQLNIPMIDVGQSKISAEALKLVPKYIAKKYNVLPIFTEGESLQIVVGEPQSVEELRDVCQNIASVTGKKVRPVLARRSLPKELIEKSYQSLR